MCTNHINAPVKMCIFGQNQILSGAQQRPMRKIVNLTLAKKSQEAPPPTPLMKRLEYHWSMVNVMIKQAIEEKLSTRARQR